MIGWAAGLILALQASQPTDDNIVESDGFRFQAIRRVDGDEDWPFVADEGRLTCVRSIGLPQVYFFPASNGKPSSPAILDMNPMTIMVQAIGRKDVFRKAATPEELIKRIAPVMVKGLALCKQKNGPVVPGSEL